MAILHLYNSLCKFYAWYWFMEIDLPNSTNLSETDNWMFFDLSASCPVTKDAYRTFISSAGSRFAVIGLHPPFPSEWYWTLQKYRTSQIKYIVKASVTRGSAYDTGGIPTLDGDTQTLDVLNLQCLLPVTWNYTIFSLFSLQGYKPNFMKMFRNVGLLFGLRGTLTSRCLSPNKNVIQF